MPERMPPPLPTGLAAPDTTLPADTFPDLLFVAPGVRWVGPVAWANAYAPGGVQVGIALPNGHVGWVMSDGETVDSGERWDDVHLDPRRCEVRAHLARLLAVGLRCPSGCTGAAPDAGCPHGCAGTGYLRKPAPCAHLMPRAELGTLPDDLARHAPFLLAHHARSVAAGGPGVTMIVSEWKHNPHDTLWTWRRNQVPLTRPGPQVSIGTYGWSIGGPMGGTETGDAGKAAADAASLAAGYALVDGDGGVRVAGVSGGR